MSDQYICQRCFLFHPAWLIYMPAFFSLSSHITGIHATHLESFISKSLTYNMLHIHTWLDSQSMRFSITFSKLFSQSEIVYLYADKITDYGFLFGFFFFEKEEGRGGGERIFYTFISLHHILLCSLKIHIYWLWVLKAPEYFRSFHVNKTFLCSFLILNLKCISLNFILFYLLLLNIFYLIDIFTYIFWIFNKCT